MEKTQEETVVEFSHDRVVSAAAASTTQLRLAAARYWVLTGQFDLVAQLTGLSPSAKASVALQLAFWNGEYSRAAVLGDELLRSMKRRNLEHLRGGDGLLPNLAF